MKIYTTESKKTDASQINGGKKKKNLDGLMVLSEEASMSESDSENSIELRSRARGSNKGSSFSEPKF